jgi:hypothetical protein
MFIKEKKIYIQNKDLKKIGTMIEILKLIFERKKRRKKMK